MKINNLTEKSDLYYDMNQIYERFSQVEDTPQKITKFLKLNVKGNVLDLGCGSGKYTSLLCENSLSYIGLDLSQNQINIAKTKSNNGKFICSSAENISLNDNSIDFGVACWVLGTILEEDRRKKVLDEIKRVLKQEGEFYLIENAYGGEFELLRGRTKDNRTCDYNNWLLNNDFKICKKFETYFEFGSIDEAKHIFSSIWGEDISKKIKSKKIKQKIIIFKFSNFN